MEREIDLPNRLIELLEHAVKASEPEVALHALSALRRELDAFERIQAWKALDGGSSDGSVARALGISSQAAHRRYRELAAATEPPPGARGPKLRVAPEARAAVQLAGEEAETLGAPRMGSEHLLLGILRAGDAVAVGGPPRERRDPGGRPPGGGADPGRRGAPRSATSQVTVYARRVFGEALRQAASDPSHVIGVADLLRAALRDYSGGACRTLDALDIDADAVRAAL